MRAGRELLLLDPPRSWSVPELPDGVRVSSEAGERLGESSITIVVAFCSALAEVRGRVADLAPRIFPDGAIWVAWPRRAGGHDSDIREDDIRSVALPLGLVDVKVARLDEDWSGLRLVSRRERRQAS